MPPCSAAKPGALKANWMVSQSEVEIGEVDDLPVEIVAPVAVDDAGEEQAGDHEEVRHAERLGEGDEACIQPSAPAAFSTPSVECIITTMTMQKPLA